MMIHVNVSMFFMAVMFPLFDSSYPGLAWRPPSADVRDQPNARSHYYGRDVMTGRASDASFKRRTIAAGLLGAT